jgi:undecaprenyl pyrophosphate phosphatase UppP
MTFDLDPVWIVLGGIASVVITALKRLIPIFGKWFDTKLSDEGRQALMLWIGIAVVAVVCLFRLWGTPMPKDPREFIALLWSCAMGVVQLLVGQSGVFRSTNKLFGNQQAAAGSVTWTDISTFRVPVAEETKSVG